MYDKLEKGINQKLKIGDWFYLNYDWGLTKIKRKSKIDITVGLKLGIYTLKDFPDMNIFSVHHSKAVMKIIEIKNRHEIIFNPRTTIKVK